MFETDDTLMGRQSDLSNNYCYNTITASFLKKRVGWGATVGAFRTHPFKKFTRSHRRCALKSITSCSINTAPLARTPLIRSDKKRQNFLTENNNKKKKTFTLHALFCSLSRMLMQGLTCTTQCMYYLHAHLGNIKCNCKGLKYCTAVFPASRLAALQIPYPNPWYSLKSSPTTESENKTVTLDLDFRQSKTIRWIH